jgi:hypothetical protein
MRVLLAILAVSALVAGCGGGASSSTGAKPASQKASGGAGTCDHVALGDQGDGTIYARVDKPTNVDCATAQTVVREWGRQQIGGRDARLPAGWRCDGNSVCRKGSASVTLTLEYPSG